MTQWRRLAAGLVIALGVVSRGGAAAAAPAAAWSNHDPIESVNRKIFWFNDHVDMYVLEPVAKGWDAIAPKRVQHALSGFFQNLRFPVVTLNQVLQGKPMAALSDVSRFAINTTVGVVGFFDPATGWGFPQHNEDFGQTLGVWGVPPGPYLVLPFFGPSNPRDTVGLTADSFCTVYPFFVGFEYTFSARMVDVVNARAQVLREVEQVKQASFDYYVAVRNGYTQRRAALVKDQAVRTPPEEEDLYTIDTNGGDQP